MASNERPLADDGFSVMEFVTAAMVLFIVAVGVLGAMSFASASSQSSALKTSALNIANQRLEQARNLPYDSVGVHYASGELGDPAGSILTPEAVGDFTVETEVGWARDPDTGLSLYKQVSVVVSWTEGLGGSVSLSTNIFGKSELVNTGDLSFEIRDLDSNDLMQGAKVTISPASGSSRAVTTGADGVAFFGHLPTGTYTVSVTKSGYIFDPASVGTVTVTADLLTGVVGYLQHPSDLQVSVTSDGTTPISGVALTLTLPGGSTRTATSNGSGSASFDNLVVGSYQLRAEAIGRAAAQTSVNIAEGGQSYEVSLTMPSRAGFLVRVIDSSGQALSGASVAVQGPAPSTAHTAGSPAVTASNGEVSFGTPADGTYTITVSKSGYATSSVSFTYDGTVGLCEVQLSTQSSGSMVIHTVDRRGRDEGREYVVVTGPNYNQRLRTDTNGYLTLTGLTPGSYRVVSESSGRSYTVVVTAGGTSYIDVRVD